MSAPGDRRRGLSVFLGAFGEPGHAFTMLALGAELAARGHDVTYETWSRWREHVEAAGMRFVSAPEGKTVKNRLHLDLAPHNTDDRDALIESLLARGATRANVGQDESAVSWTVLADPEGNEFCVLSARE